MINGDAIAYNVAVFISTLFLLEFGADKFVDHTAIVARRTGIPDTVIALLTAGAEWEELVVVVASLAQGRPSLAVGNIIGSAISNVLGAFSLGLLFRPTGSHVEFDRSAKIYSLCLLVITTFVTPIIYFSQRIAWLICGSVLIALFVIYLISISWAISRGSLTAPEVSDDDSSDDESDILSAQSTPSVRTPLLPGNDEREPGDRNERDQRVDGCPEAAVVTNVSSRRRRRSLGYHIGFLVLGFLAICLSGYVLSHAAINVTDAIGISDVLFGIVILAIATTLPEKFVAVLSGNRGHVGILVANTVGSNVFLLSLCLGIVMVDTSGNVDGGNVNVPELFVLWGSTLALTITVWYGERFDRWIGGAMLSGYIVFIVLEFTIFLVPESPDLNAINLSVVFPDTNPTSSLEPNINENTNIWSQIDSWGYGTAGRPKKTAKRDTYASQPVGSDAAYCRRDGNTRYPYGQGGQSTVYEQVLVCLPTLSAEDNTAVAQQALCKLHQWPRAQQDRYAVVDETERSTTQS
ncbi:hypothetical protein FACUT_7991 [Fusarium acutatum]|uniref:Sodium/calcium exchanger membrane region domain-containing protein n=1 Tax=Fusarium acutatum TaxID=78861 RepID=A0A8H4NIK6_9HYPO|nr:hypothetical protein FACUT_7991 [Fusarium acutatum]